MSKQEGAQAQRSSETTSEDQDHSRSESDEEMTMTNETSDGQPSTEGAGEEELVVTPTPEFRHPLLKGKSPEEIERIFETQEAAVREQNQELNRLHEKVTTSQPSAPQPGTPTRPQPEEEDDDYGDDFLAPRLRKLENRLARNMERMVAPLAKELKAGQSVTVRDQLRGELKHFSRLEPHIDQLIRNQGGNPNEATKEHLTFLYHTAVGLAAERGVNLNEDTSQQSQQNQNQNQQAQRQPPVNIPQHRPSSAPLPAQNQGQKPVRPLTENERRLAREYFPTAQDPEAEYRRLQDAHEDEIVTPGFSKEGW